MSRRQRRRFVDASGFGNHLPKGWKLLLGLKRKEGSAWVNCRRFVSPNGHHFETCKQVSSYIQSLLGIVIPNDSTLISTKTETSSFGANDTTLVSTKTETSSFGANTPSLLPVRNTEPKSENNSTQQECIKCHINFTDKKLYLQHQLSFHQKSRKRRRRNSEQNDELIMKDGKYICQYCEKSFEERSRYFGHMGAHVRYQGVGIGNPRNGVGNPKIGEVGGNPSLRVKKSERGVEMVVDDSMGEKSLLDNGNPKIGEMSRVGNPRIEIEPLVENPKNGGKDLVERIEITPLVENPNNGEKPLNGNPRIENTLLVGNPKNIEKPLVESPRNEKIPSIENPKTDKAPSFENPKNIEMPLVENPKTIDTNSNEVPLSSENPKTEKLNSIEVPLSSENPKNTETGVSSSTQNPQTPKSPETQIPLIIQNPKTEIQISPLFELQTLSSIQSPINQTIPFQNNNTINKEIEMDINTNNNSNNNTNISEEFYEMNEDEYPPITYPQMVSQIFSPDDLYEENEISNNDDNNNNEEEMDKCHEMETFDLNNFDIVSNSNNSNNATNICKASSEETSFMDEGNEINESQLASRPITFSELLANANAHANANLDLNTINNNPNPNPNNNLNTNNNNNHQHLMQSSIPEFHWTAPLLNPNSLLPLNPKPNNNNYSPLNPNSITELIPKPNSNNNYSCFPPSVNNFDMNMEWVKPARYENDNNNNNQASGVGRNFMEMMTMQDTGLDESFTSMVQSAAGTSSNTLHMNNNLNNNIGGYQHHQYNASPIPNYVNNSNYNNNNVLFNFGPQMVNPSLQLGWGIPMPAHQQSNSVCVSVCVWCAREFRHEAAGSVSQQADSLGFICPSCKDRFSAGHLGL